MTATLRAPPVTPLHVEDIDRLPLRVFASPRHRRDGRPDLPWHSADDLRAVLHLPEPMRAVFQRRMKVDLAEEVETVATPDGLTMIAPMHMGRGMIDFVRFRRAILPTEARRRAESGFLRAHTRAMPLMLPGMHPLERLAFFMEAMDRAG